MSLLVGPGSPPASPLGVRCMPLASSPRALAWGARLRPRRALRGAGLSLPLVVVDWRSKLKVLKRVVRETNPKRART